jgi:hypothetical protein
MSQINYNLNDISGGAIGTSIGKGFILVFPLVGLVLAIVYIKSLLSDPDGNLWKTKKCDNQEKKLKRASTRGQIVSSSLMVLAIFQAFIKATNPPEKILLTTYGFLFASVVGYIGDQMIGTDEGMSLYQHKNKNISGNWAYRYAMGTLGTGAFFRYMLTVFLDMFVSGCLIDIMMFLTKDMVKELSEDQGTFGFYKRFVGGNFDNLMQSVVALITFLAYTNDTRFAWAYPSSTATYADIIPTPTIKLATTIAGIVYLIANVPKSESGKTKTAPNKQYGGDLNIPGTPLADSIGSKFIYVMITLFLLSMGSQKTLFNIDPIEDTKNMSEKAKEQNIEMKWYVAQGWKKGIAIFSIFFILGITVPLLMNGLESTAARGTVNVVALIITIASLGFVFMKCYNADDKHIEKGITDCGGTAEPEEVVLKNTLSNEVCDRDVSKTNCVNTNSFFYKNCELSCSNFNNKPTVTPDNTSTELTNNLGDDECNTTKSKTNCEQTFFFNNCKKACTELNISPLSTGTGTTGAGTTGAGTTGAGTTGAGTTGAGTTGAGTTGTGTTGASTTGTGTTGTTTGSTTGSTSTSGSAETTGTSTTGSSSGSGTSSNTNEQSIKEYGGEVKKEFETAYCKSLKTGKCLLLTKASHKKYPNSWGRFPLTKKGGQEFCKLFKGNKNKPLNDIIYYGSLDGAKDWCYGSR